MVRHRPNLREKQGVQFHETGSPNQCQCDIKCNNKSLPGKAFCQVHINNCPRISPISGAEPDYDPNLWNNDMKFRKTHNCFSYAMNVRDPKQIAKCLGKKKCSVPFHQPGSAAGHPGFSESKPKTCPNMLARIFGDNSSVIMSDFTSQCPANYSKIAVIVDQSDDYHFLRQDSNRFWSHKPGSQKVINIDAYGHKIWDPKLANYNYAEVDSEASLNYDIFCSYLCVPRNRPLYLKPSSGGSRRVTTRSSSPPSSVTRPFRTAKTRRSSRG
jgi:hypothetical protein